MAVLGFHGSVPLLPKSGGAVVEYGYTFYRQFRASHGSGYKYQAILSDANLTVGSTEENGYANAFEKVTIGGGMYRIILNTVSGDSWTWLRHYDTVLTSWADLNEITIPTTVTGDFSFTETFDIPKDDKLQFRSLRSGSGGTWVSGYLKVFIH